MQLKNTEGAPQIIRNLPQKAPQKDEVTLLYTQRGVDVWRFAKQAAPVVVWYSAAGVTGIFVGLVRLVSFTGSRVFYGGAWIFGRLDRLSLKLLSSYEDLFLSRPAPKRPTGLPSDEDGHYTHVYSGQERTSVTYNIDNRGGQTIITNN